MHTLLTCSSISTNLFYRNVYRDTKICVEMIAALFIIMKNIICKNEKYELRWIPIHTEMTNDLWYNHTLLNGFLSFCPSR